MKTKIQTAYDEKIAASAAVKDAKRSLDEIDADADWSDPWGKHPRSAAQIAARAAYAAADQRLMALEDAAESAINAPLAGIVGADLDADTDRTGRRYGW